MSTPPRHESAVGRRVQVLWDGDAWYEGVVAEYSEEYGYFVKYDDGEEQWEDADGAVEIRFLDDPGTSAAPHTELVAGVSILPASASAASLGDTDYLLDTPKRSHHGDDNLSPSPEDDADSAAAMGKGDTVHKPRKATNYVNNAVFFRDEDTLREMKQALLKEKKALLSQRDTIQKQLAMQESIEKQVKQELLELKTKVTLGNLSLRAVSQDSASVAPKSAVEWQERALDTRLENQQTKKDIVELKGALSSKQRRLDQLRRDCAVLQQKVASTPKRDLSTLVELQVEIANLLEEKRKLEAQLRQGKTAGSGRSERNLRSAQPAYDGITAATKADLESELAKLDLLCARLQEDAQRQKLQYERERARLMPLQDRLRALQSELQQYRSSHVLLRSVFVRMDREGRGEIPRELAIHALASLAPPEAESLDAAAIKRQLQSSAASTESGVVAFRDFVVMFEHIFGTSS